jgi:hypothetical protein
MNRPNAIPAIDAALIKLGESILDNETKHLFCVGKRIQVCGNEVEVGITFRWAMDYDEAINAQLEEEQ